MSDAVNLRIDPRNGEKNWTDPFSEELVVEEFEELPGVYGVLLTQVPHPTSIEVYRALDPSVPLTRITTTGEPDSDQFWSDSQQLKPRGYVIVNSTLYAEGLIIVYRGGGYLAHKRVLETVIPEGPPGPPGGVDSVFGRSGNVTAQTSDYTQDQVTDGTTYKQFSATEKTKLAGIATGADVTATAINATSKSTIVDNDRFAGADSENSNSVVYWLWSTIVAKLKLLFGDIPSSFTSTLTGFGTISGLTSYYWTSNGGKVGHFEITFTSGTSTAVEARASLPWTSAADYPTLAVCGVGAASNNVSGAGVVALIEPSKAYITFGLAREATTNGLEKRNGDAFGNSNTISISGRIRLT